MLSAFRWNLLSCWSVISVVLLTLPAGVRAGCDHPWVQTTATASSLTDLALLSADDHTDRLQPGLPVPATRPGPCAFGTCSQPLGFPPASTISVPGRAELWGPLSFQSPSLSAVAVGLCREPGCDRPRRSVSPIERPPRCLVPTL